MKKWGFEFIYVSVPKIIGGVCTISVNVVLLRYFGPEHFGIFTLYLTGILLVDGIFGSAIDTGVLRLAPMYHIDEPTRSYAIEKTALLLKLVIVLPFCILLIFFAKPLTHGLFHQEGTEHVLYISSFAALAMLMMRSALVNLQIREKFIWYGVLDFIHILLKYGGLALLLIFFHVSVGAVLVFYAIGPACIFIIWLGTFGRKIFQQIQTHLKVASELIGYVKWFFLTFSLGALISRLDILMLTMSASIGEVGIFSGGQSFAVIPELIGTYLAVVVSPRIMPYCRMGRFNKFFRRFQTMILLTSFAAYLVSLLFMDVLTVYLLPGTFSRSAGVLLILLPGTFFAMATFPLTISFLMFMRPRFLFIMDIITLPLIIILYIYAINHYGAIGAAWVTTGSRFFKGTIVHFVAWKLAGRTKDIISQDIATASI